MPLLCSLMTLLKVQVHFRAAVFLAAAAAILIRRKRSKPQETDAAWSEWEDPESEPEDPGKTEE